MLMRLRPVDGAARRGVRFHGVGVAARAEHAPARLLNRLCVVERLQEGVGVVRLDGARMREIEPQPVRRAVLS